MAAKKYTCNSSAFGFRVNVDGKEVLVEFRSANRSQKDSELVVADPKLQAAIEKSAYFGSVVLLKDAPSYKKKDAVPPKDVVPKEDHIGGNPVLIE